MTDIRKNVYAAPINNAIDFILSQKDVNIIDEHEMTMLHWSCCRKDGLPVVEILLYLGIDKDRENSMNRTSLEIA